MGMRQLVVITGKTGAGKSSLAAILHKKMGYHSIKTSSLVKDICFSRGLCSTDRIFLQEYGDELDKETDYTWIADELKKCSGTLPKEQGIVVDNIRNPGQLAKIRACPDWKILHIHLYATQDIIESRFYGKHQGTEETTTIDYSEADLLKDNSDVEVFKNDADLRIWTTRSDEDDLFARIAPRLGGYAPPIGQCVDVLIGGQYGSEGKGHLAAYLAKEYDVLVRVGGPNAGHKVSSKSGVFTYHHLPSGCKDTNAEVLLGPGMTLRPNDLLTEIKECNISPGNIFIDPQAMIIEEEDIQSERELVSSIASTGRGGGAAAARRIMCRKTGGVRLARDCEELKPYIGATLERLELAYQRRKSILLEGTQGSGLSIFHGQYPYVTSRDTNVAGCLAEAGIAPTRVRRIIMVVRTHPIRVGNPDDTKGSSGLLKHETTWEEIGKRARIGAEELRRAEKTSTTHRLRRVGYFEWDQFRKACSLNAPTDIALTFTDYLHPDNRNARRFEQLDDETIYLIEELERVSQAHVSLINTRFPFNDDKSQDMRSVIDRRDWSGLWNPNK